MCMPLTQHTVVICSHIYLSLRRESHAPHWCIPLGPQETLYKYKLLEYHICLSSKSFLQYEFSVMADTASCLVYITLLTNRNWIWFGGTICRPHWSIIPYGIILSKRCGCKYLEFPCLAWGCEVGGGMVIFLLWGINYKIKRHRLSMAVWKT